MLRRFLYVDDFPGYVLAGFGEYRFVHGHYPRLLIVSPLLSEIMGARPGLWRPSAAAGVWRWVGETPKCLAHGVDEFGAAEEI